MKEIEIVGQKYLRVDDFNLFRQENATRRIGMEYWIRMQLDGTVYLQQHIITERTKIDRLKKEMDLGVVYIHKLDHEIFSLTAEKLKS